MARSTYIYIAYDQDGTVIVAGTVKYEVVNYVKRHAADICVYIRSYCDGKGPGYNVLDLKKELGT